MQLDNMILIRIDDHTIESPGRYGRPLPAKEEDQAPKIVRMADGVAQWVPQGQAASTPETPFAFRKETENPS